MLHEMLGRVVSLLTHVFRIQFVCKCQAHQSRDITILKLFKPFLGRFSVDLPAMEGCVSITIILLQKQLVALITHLVYSCHMHTCSPPQR